MLEKFLVSELFTFLMVFCRVGSGIMVMPGFSETFVLARARLILALTISLVIAPLVSQYMPPIPGTAAMLLVLLFAEIMIGLFIGGICRLLISAVHVAGMLIAYQSSLATAFMLDVQFAGQATPIGNLLTVIAAVLLFATDMHHLMLKGLIDSYSLFTPGVFPQVEDFAKLSIQTMSRSFAVAVQIASPFLVIGLVIYLVAGIIARLMPTMQVFFLLMPPQIMLSLFILMSTLSAIMLWFINYFEETMKGFLTP
jgi:flagellar biosynthetic protein FliR